MAGPVGHQHPSVFHLVSVLQQDVALAETLIVQDARGQARVAKNGTSDRGRGN